ncbi:hypothetical protein VDGL01_01737 [Verticillium dahliae]
MKDPRPSCWACGLWSSLVPGSSQPSSQLLLSIAESHRGWAPWIYPCEHEPSVNAVLDPV